MCKTYADVRFDLQVKTKLSMSNFIIVVGITSSLSVWLGSVRHSQHYHSLSNLGRINEDTAVYLKKPTDATD